MAASFCICDHCGRIYFRRDNEKNKLNLNFCHICHHKLYNLYTEIVKFINIDKPDVDIYRNDPANSIAFMTPEYLSMSLGMDTKSIENAIKIFFDDFSTIPSLVNKIYACKGDYSQVGIKREEGFELC